MIAFYLFIVMNLFNKLQAQPIVQPVYPGLDSVLSILNVSDSLKLNAELSEFKNSYRWSWWYVFPSLGYDMINSRPMLVFNTGQVLSFFTNKRIMERRIIAINKRHLILHENNRIQIEKLYADLLNKSFQLQLVQSAFIRYQSFFEIKELQYKENEINTEVFLREQIAFDERKKSFMVQIDNINRIMLDIELILNVKIFKAFVYSDFINI